MVYDNWDINASDIDLKIDLYNKLIMQHKNDIKNLEDKIEKCCLQQMEIDLEHVINLLRQEARELENPAP